MDLVFHRLVPNDLHAVLRYYESEGGAALADRFFEELQVMVAEIPRRPTSFHPADEGLRRANLKSFPYHLLFRVRPTSVRVLVLRHHRKQSDFGMDRI